MLPQLFDALAAPGPHPSLGVHSKTYGRLIGSWAGEVRDHTPSGVMVGPVEIHFAWVLEGRAVQDAWIAPPRATRGHGSATSRCRYGTTLRVFQPADETWQVVWLDPGSGVRSDLVGRQVGDDVVQLGVRGGRPIRWSFRDIQPNAFRWEGHTLEPDGTTWRLDTEFLVGRTQGPA